MTIRLLCAYDRYPANAIVTLDAGTEAGLIVAKQASSDLTGGTVFAPASNALQQKYSAFTVRVGRAETILLPEGQALSLVGSVGVTGSVSRVDASGAVIGVAAAAVAGSMPQFGPFQGSQRVLIACTAGTIDAMVVDAVVAQRSYLATVTAPSPTGDSAKDFAALRDFFANSANTQHIVFPHNAVYPIYSGAVQLKPGQIVDLNGSVLQRAPELVYTTTTKVGNTSTSVGLSSVTGLQAGMSVIVKGPGDTTGHTLIGTQGTNSDTPLRVLSINPDTKVVTFEAALSLVIDDSSGGNSNELLDVGATFVVKSVMIDATSKIAGSAFTLLNASVDGNWAQNQTANYWASAIELMCYSTGGTVDNFTSINAPGEVYMQHGNQAVLNNFKVTNCRGNAIHLNGYNKNTIMTQLDIDGCNLDIGVGHANGAIIASNNTYRAIVDGFNVRAARLFGIGSWDSSDNAFAKIVNGYVRDCWGGAFQLYNGGSAVAEPSDCHVTNVDVRNCGTSYIGSDPTTTTVAAYARNMHFSKVNFYDSMASFTKLEDSSIDVRFVHTDSGTLTGSSSASGRKDASGTAMNFGGKMNLSSVGGSSNYAAGADVFGVCTLGPFINCDIKVYSRDGTVVAPPTIYSSQAMSFTIVAPGGTAGPTVGTKFDLVSVGGHSGPHLEGTFFDTDVNATCAGYGKVSGSTAEAFQFYNKTNAANALFPSVATNGIMGVTPGGTANVNDANHPGLGWGSGGATTRTRYDMIFTGGTPTVNASGYFFVEDGALTDWKITEPGQYATAPTISLANATGLVNATLSPVMGVCRTKRIPQGNRIKAYIHTAKNPSGGYMCKIDQDTTNAAGAGELEVDVILVADDSGGGKAFSDANREMTNVYLKRVKLIDPGNNFSAANAFDIRALTGGNIGSCRIGEVTSTNSSVSFATPVGWKTYYTQRGSTLAAFAPVGYVGEILTATKASGAAVSLTTATAADVLTLAVTKGNWVMTGNVDYALGGATATSFKSGPSVTLNTLPTQAGGSGLGTDGLASLPLAMTTVTDTLTQASTTTLSVAADTTLHLVAQATFSAGTVAAYGTLSAERVA
jgi:hypothetical protein